MTGEWQLRFQDYWKLITKKFPDNHKLHINSTGIAAYIINEATSRPILMETIFNRYLLQAKECTAADLLTHGNNCSQFSSKSSIARYMPESGY